jgi:hypothetical protein
MNRRIILGLVGLAVAVAVLLLIRPSIFTEGFLADMSEGIYTSLVANAVAAMPAAQAATYMADLAGIVALKKAAVSGASATSKVAVAKVGVDAIDTKLNELRPYYSTQSQYSFAQVKQKYFQRLLQSLAPTDVPEMRTALFMKMNNLANEIAAAPAAAPAATPVMQKPVPIVAATPAPISGSEAPAPAPAPAPVPAPASASQITRSDLKMLKDDIIAALKMDATVKAPAAAAPSPAAAPTACMQQGVQYVADQAAACTSPDYIRKDSIPCWGCKL